MGRRGRVTIGPTYQAEYERAAKPPSGFFTYAQQYQPDRCIVAPRSVSQIRFFLDPCSCGFHDLWCKYTTSRPQKRKLIMTPQTCLPQFTIMPILGAVALAANLAGAGENDGPIGDAVNDLPIFDGHVHYKEPAWSAYPVERIIGLFDRTGVAMGLVSSTPDAGTIRLWEYAPNRVVPELRPYHGDAGSSNWTGFPEMGAYLEDRLKHYPHEGIGEFHIRNREMWDEALFRDIIRMAKQRDLFLHVHSDAQPIRWLYELDPDVKIIWAHLGLGEPASEVYRLMAEYPDLVADTSLREYEIMGSGDALDPAWERIIFDFQDRLMVGSDTWINSQWDNYEAIIASNRRWLSLLPRSIAEKIAFRNAERLFGRSVSNNLIGKR